MNQPALCPTCGCSIPPDAPEGVCPACALGRGIGLASASGMAKEEAAFRQAEMETLAAAFPQFELIELLGRGGMGEVYKARQKKLGRLVAIKILPEPFGKSDEYTERFLREARSLALLNHPNIVTIYDFGDADGLCYFVMEYIDGVDLRRMIEAHTLSPDEALRIVPQICDALQFAHDAGIVHRDIKPANILIDKQGRVKIADFGLAKIVSKEAKDFTLTGAGEIMGTAEYMAPEQRRSSQSVDHRADIYSLGVVFYEMLTGEVPMGRFDPPSKRVSVDVRLDDVVLRTLEREPERRYQKASELKTSVEAINGSPQSSTATASPLIAGSRRFPKRFAFASATVFAGAWFLCLSFWKYQWWGILLSGVVMFGLIYGLVAIGRRWFPIIAINWKRDRPLNHIARCGIALVHCIIGYYFVLGAMLAVQERAHWRFPYKSIEDFQEQTKGKEYRLVRLLPAFEKSIPNVEFATKTFGWTRGVAFFGPAAPNLGLFPKFGFWMMLITGIVILANAVNTLVATNIWSFGMDKAWRLTRWPIFTLGMAILAGWCVNQYYMMIAGLGGHSPSSQGVLAKLPLKEARSRVERVLEADAHYEDGKVSKGFALGEFGEWWMNTVPEGNTIGTVGFMNAWMRSPFDRWEWRRGTLVTVAPQIQILYLSSQQPNETMVRIHIAWPNAKPASGEVEAIINRITNSLQGE